VETALKLVKSGKAAGVDGILPEFLKYLGFNSKVWLVILKPGKPDSDPKSYRPISSLSVVYKLFERVLLT